METAIMVCIFLLTVLVLGQILHYSNRSKRLVADRLKKTVAIPVPTVKAGSPAHSDWKKERWLEFISFPGTLIGRRYLEKLQANLVKAGLPLKAEEAVIITVVAVVLGAGLGLLLTASLLWSVLLGIGGLMVPMIIVRSLQKQRLHNLEGQLLNALVLLANSLRAGHSFMQAMELVSRETPPPLSTEFGRVIQETRVGILVEDALTNFGTRVESKDVQLLVTGVLIQRQVGGNLAEVIDSIAKTIETRIKNRAKIKVLTAQGRMSAWIVSLLPFALAGVVFGKNPKFLQIMLDGIIGQALLGGGFLMLIIGVMVIRKVVNIDV